MTEFAPDTTRSAGAAAPAQICITEQTVADIAEVLVWFDLPPHKADKAAREVLATIALTGSVPAQHVPTQPAASRSVPAHPESAPARHQVPRTAPVTMDVGLAGLALPDPTAPGARALVVDRYGDLVVDDGLRYRTPHEAETDGFALVRAGQQADGLALIAAARRAHEVAAAGTRRRR